MSSTFYRWNTDQTRTDVPLEGLFAGPTLSACWLIGGGPSLSRLPFQDIAASPIPRMSINLAGSGLLRPTFWTSYDPSDRFHRSLYLDPGVMKFVQRRRAMDLVPETTFKVCDCPNTYFFDRDGDRGFADFLAPGQHGIVDWADTLVQAIDILYRLGFRIIYLAGCDMRVCPSAEQIRRAAEKGVAYNPRGLLSDFVQDCEAAGLSVEELDALQAGAHYHFGERKPIQSAANTDFHYFRVAQYLRLSRRALALAGVQLISVTPHSRLNDDFPYLPASQVMRRIEREVGNPQREPVSGLNHQTDDRQPLRLGPMRDFRPHGWKFQRRHRQPAVGRNGARPPDVKDGELLSEHEDAARLHTPCCETPVVPSQRPAPELQRIPDEWFGPDETG